MIFGTSWITPNKNESSKVETWSPKKERTSFINGEVFENQMKLSRISNHFADYTKKIQSNPATFEVVLY